MCMCLHIYDFTPVKCDSSLPASRFVTSLTRTRLISLCSMEAYHVGYLLDQDCQIPTSYVLSKGM